MTDLTPTSDSDKSVAERERRAFAVSFARGSVRYEGGVLTAKAEEITTRFINDELDLHEFVAAVLMSDTVEFDR